MKKIILFILIGIMFAGLASAECYQEFANISSACGGLATGTYTQNVNHGTAWTNFGNVVDGNWGTFGVSSNPGSGSDYVVNYTKPAGYTGAKVMWKNNGVFENYTVNASCFHAYSSVLSLYIGSGNDGTLNCLNPSGYLLMKHTIGGNQIYEEGIYWTNSSEDPLIMPCSTDYPYPYINFTFKDEDTGTSLNASMSGTTVRDNNANSTYTNNTELKSIAFCSYNTTAVVDATFYVPYTSGTYPQRVYERTFTLTNTTTNIILYLLGASTGQYTTFQLVNAAEQPLEDVLVVLNKSISGTQTTISSGFTGADGGITFWLNPDDQYTISAYLSPYPSYSTTQAFTQDSYTITLGSNSEINASDFTKGVTYSIKPTDEWLSNGTTYNFNLTLSSAYWALDSWGFNITNGSHTWLGNVTNTTSTGGISKLNLNTGANSSLILTYFWTVGNSTTYAVRIYRILDFNNNGYSITRLINDFVSYKASGFFGLTDWGMGLIVFFIIVGSVGAAKVKFGISDESLLLGMLIGLVALADVGFGLIPNPVNAIPHFPVIVLIIIFVGMGTRDMLR